MQCSVGWWVLARVSNRCASGNTMVCLRKGVTQDPRMPDSLGVFSRRAGAVTPRDQFLFLFLYRSVRINGFKFCMRVHGEAQDPGMPDCFGNFFKEGRCSDSERSAPLVFSLQLCYIGMGLAKSWHRRVQEWLISACTCSVDT